MAITISTYPAKILGVYNPITFAMTSNRLAQSVFTVNTVTNSSGKCQYDVTKDTANVVVGDTFLPATTVSSYNYLQTVTAVDSTGPAYSITTDATYVSTATGTLTRQNTNFKIRAEVYIRNGGTFEIDTVADRSGYARLINSNEDVVGAGWAVGDTILVFDIQAGYAGKTTIYAIGNTSGYDYVDTTKAYISNDNGYFMKMDLLCKKYALENNSVFTFDFQNVLRTALSGYFASIGATEMTSPALHTGISNFYVLFTEMFEASDGTYYDGSTAESGYQYCPDQIVNIINQRNEVTTVTRFVQAAGQTGRLFLTDIPNNSYIHVNDEFRLDFLTSETSIKFKYTQYNLAGVAQTPVTSDAVTMVYAGDDYRRGYIPISSASSVIGTSVSKVDIVLVNASTGAALSETKTFYVDQKTYSTQKVLEFVNRRGGVDTYRFLASEQTSINTKREFYKSSNYKYTYDTNPSKRIRLIGRIEKATTLDWLEQLYTSTDVYLVDSSYTGGRVKVNIIDADFITQSYELIQPVCEIEVQKPLYQ